MTIELRRRFCDIALSQVGLKEEPGHPNVGPDIVKYQKCTTLAPGGWPWCAAFVAWVLREWLLADDVRGVLGLPSWNAADQWRCKSARAFDWESWGVVHGLFVEDESHLAKMGDIITFDFSHIGIVVEDEVPGQKLMTVEGNTNSAGSRDGDGVWRKLRADSLTRKYIRILQE